jgi:rhomboid protease GluP
VSWGAARARTALAQDTTAVAVDGEWHRLLTAGLLHSGLLPLVCCADGVRNAGSWVEAYCGSLQAVVTVVLCAAGAGLGQLLAGRADTGLAGAGVCTGLYAAWLTLGLTRGRGVMPITSDRGVLYALLNALMAAYQPAVGFACLAGGALGGVAGTLLAPLLARVLYTCTAVTAAVALSLARAALETVRLGLGVVLALLVATFRAAGEVARTVRGL